MKHQSFVDPRSDTPAAANTMKNMLNFSIPSIFTVTPYQQATQFKHPLCYCILLDYGLPFELTMLHCIRHASQFKTRTLKPRFSGANFSVIKNITRYKNNTNADCLLLDTRNSLPEQNNATA
jgi:hypothetical protein